MKIGKCLSMHGRTGLTMLLCSASMVGQAAAVIDRVNLVAKSPTYAAAAPQAKTFVVATDGSLSIDVSDIGFPYPLSSPQVIVTRGAERVHQGLGFATTSFAATPGEYMVNALASGTMPGTLGISVTAAGGVTPLLDYQAGVNPQPIAARTAQTVIVETVTVSVAGTYRATLTDRHFPTALASIDAVIKNAQGMTLGRLCAPIVAADCSSDSVDMTLGTGNYTLAVNAVAAQPLQAGLFSLQITGAGATLFSQSQPVGVLESHAFIDLPVSGQYTLKVSDLAFPDALAQAKVAVTQGADLLADISFGGTSETTQTFSAAQPGTATLYTFATPAGSSGVGALGVQLPFGNNVLYSNTQAVTGSVTGLRAYVFEGQFPAAGNYRVRAHDFAFPTLIPTLQFLVTQNGRALGGFNVGGSVEVPAQAGRFEIVAIANMFSASATGLFSVVAEDVAQGAVVLSRTQGVGDLFQTQDITIDHDGLFTATLSDLAFPVAMDNLALLVTSGDDVLGQIYGGGTTAFSATPGTYALNFVAIPKANANYGMYGIKVADAPPAPTLTFTSNAQSVQRGANVMLSWQASGADSCVASDGPSSWSGSRPTTASNVSVGPINAATQLTLTCTGLGGTTSAQVSVAVPQENTSTGGGTLSLWWCAACFMLFVASRRREIFLH